MISIRKAVPGDEYAVFELANQFEPYTIPVDRRDFRLTFRNILSQKEIYLAVAMNEYGVIGYLLGSVRQTFHAKIARIEELVVETELCSRRVGEPELIQAFEEWARAKRCHVVKATDMRANDYPGHGYQKAGFSYRKRLSEKPANKLECLIRKATPGDEEAVFKVAKHFDSSFKVNESDFKVAFLDILSHEDMYLRVGFESLELVAYLLGSVFSSFHAKVARVEENGLEREWAWDDYPGPPLATAFEEWAVAKSCQFIKGTSSLQPSYFYQPLGYKKKGFYYRKLL